MPLNDKPSRDAVYWAQHVSTLKVTRVPTGALDLNVEGRRVVGPLQGFGQMWQKFYWTVMTPQGHPIAGWITFSAYEEEGDTIAQIHILMRANDPIYEAGLFLTGSRGEDGLWHHTLTSLATYFGVRAPVQMQKSCIDPRLQWSEARNVWQNAGVRTVLYEMLTPVRWVLKRIRGEASTKGTT